ncbi:hypothetical protein [Belnapia moabensis]|uniref:hypothetical protein n=1 Tax=Belnapia moabensis TaxID=365533 RepID=UPI0005BB1A92|nr:hypothetical protein [Belnapia moabensis]
MNSYAVIAYAAPVAAFLFGWLAVALHRRSLRAGTTLKVSQDAATATGVALDTQLAELAREHARLQTHIEQIARESARARFGNTRAPSGTAPAR